MFENIENEIKKSLDDVLLNAEFQCEDKKLPIEIPKIITDIFMPYIAKYYPDLTTFDVKPIYQQNVILVKFQKENNNTMLDVLMATDLNGDIIKIKNILISLKNN